MLRIWFYIVKRRYDTFGSTKTLLHIYAISMLVCVIYTCDIINMQTQGHVFNVVLCKCYVICVNVMLFGYVVFGCVWLHLVVFG